MIRRIDMRVHTDYGTLEECCSVIGRPDILFFYDPVTGECDAICLSDFPTAC